MIQTVKELIDELKKCNPDYPVRIYFNDDIKEIQLVDNTLQDRVDINMLEEDAASKIYIRKVYENNKYTISFGTDEDVKDWKAEEKEWIEQDFSVADDSIELLCELQNYNLSEVLQKINKEIKNATT